ncbi:transglycosylase SLT domain protein [Anopheles sinensis]|uniref:Transglycosylase SLT domain protein n=1 Tax=Anopheles sinensis TaxID=74873 RepID=A0A084VTI8_ANOSI|nr:transglycosylase SLT domain protein [Anopheles sinensis]
MHGHEDTGVPPPARDTLLGTERDAPAHRAVRAGPSNERGAVVAAACCEDDYDVFICQLHLKDGTDPIKLYAVIFHRVRFVTFRGDTRGPTRGGGEEGFA